MRRVMLLTTASAILALSAGPLLARGGEGGGGERGGGGAGANVGGEGAHVGGEGVHVNSGNAEVRGAPNASTHVSPNAGLSADAARRGRAAPNVIPREGDRSEFAGRDGWRYRYDNGQWWYWLPGNRWTYYDNGGWQDYAADNTTYDNSTAAATVDVPSDPNYYWYNNQWWYWLPGANRWSYYDHGGWRDGAPGMGPQRRETGYRGVLNNGAENHGVLNNEQHAPNRTEAPREVRPVTPDAHGSINAAPHLEGPVGPRK